MKFMLDHNLPPALARGLDELSRPDGHQVIALREKFPTDSKDEAWISGLGHEGGWAVVSGDTSIFKSDVRVAAWREAKLTIFFLAPGWSALNYWPKVTKFVHQWPGILALATNVRAGALYRVRVTGKPDPLAPP